MAAFSDEVFEATQRLLKAQQQMTRAVLDRAGQDAIAGEEEPAGHQDRDDQLTDEQPGEVDEAGDVEDEEPVDEADEEPVDEADEEPVDEVDEEPVDSQIGRNRVPARAKSRAPAAPKRSTRGRRRSA
jgi:hypothetical protein